MMRKNRRRERYVIIFMRYVLYARSIPFRRERARAKKMPIRELKTKLYIIIIS